MEDVLVVESARVPRRLAVMTHSRGPITVLFVVQAAFFAGAERALLRTTVAVFKSVQSIMTASKRWRVSWRIAPSGSVECSMAISRSLSTRRRTRTIFSSEHNTIGYDAVSRLFIQHRLTIATAPVAEPALT